jgi:DNA polymerase III gamma/tau subunit
LKVINDRPAHVMFKFSTNNPKKAVGTIPSRPHHTQIEIGKPEALTGNRI